MIELLLAFGAGVLTLINPCVLPLVPIILAGSISRHPLGPLALAGGLAASFTLFGFGAYAFAQSVGLQTEDISAIGAILMIAFGAVLVVPQASAAFARATTGIAGGGNKAIGAVEGNTVFGQFASGALLGLVWSPCIGPTLGGAIALASQGESLFWAFLIMAFFSLGSAAIVLALGYGSRELIRARRDRLMALMPYARPMMGIALILVGLGIWFHVDKLIEFWALETLPAWFTDLSVAI